jgi:glucokinase
MTRATIGVDLGGTNLRAAVVGDDGTLAGHHRERVGEPRDPATVIERCAQVITGLAPGGTVGVGIAAMLRDRRGTIARSPHLRWDDVAFGERLAARLGPAYGVGVYNDVNAIVYGEASAGAARGCRDVLGVYVGTGIGGGVIANGELVEGTSNSAGEIGHTKVRWDDSAAPCACGGRGCVEAYAGGTYLQARIRKELAAGARSSAVTQAGGLEHVTSSHVDLAAAEGDAWALGLWTEVAPLIAVALANAICVLNCERLVLGGGVLARAPTLYQLVEASLWIALPSALREPLTVVPAELGDDAGLVGAARLAAAGVSIVTA